MWRLGILDTVAEQSFDDLAILASHICKTPIALVSLVDAKRQWFKARVGVALTETPREHSFCSVAIGQPGVFTVNNTLEDERFVHNPLVTGAPQIRFYAGAPLITSDGDAIGTICVIDSEPRELSSAQADALQALSRLVMKQIELRLALQQLEQSSKDLVIASRQAGMAEVATGILHNVGNVLNSVNVAATCLSDRVRHSKVSRVARVASLLREHRADLPGFFRSPPGQELPVYLEQLGEHLASEQTVSLQELADLRKHIEHINNIVAMQQSFSQLSGVTMLVSPEQLVEDALQINLSSLENRKIAIIRDYEQTPAITLDKHKALQILINLLRNAIQAYDDIEVGDKQLRLGLRQAGTRIGITVSDNGVGIPPENLTRIFSHGFSTKKTGHGLGLHASALAARELGGKLSAQSDGPGRGATFTLELPNNSGTSAN